jgi:nitrogen regulatory protein PII
MMLVSAVIRPCRLGDVQQALLGIGAECVAVTQVEGFGRQKGHAVQYQGAEYLADSIPKVRIDAIVSESAMARFSCSVSAQCPARPETMPRTTRDTNRQSRKRSYDHTRSA